MSRALALLVFGAVACSSAAPTEQSRAAIIRGIDSDKSQDFAILLYDFLNDNACTGTLVAPNLVLTARHCVSRVQMQSFGCDDKGNVYGISGPQILGDWAPGDLQVFVGSVRANPYGQNPDGIGAQIYHDGAKNLCGHDLALLLLDREIPNIPRPQIRLDQPVATGQTLTAVGWGVSLTSIQPLYRQQRQNVKIFAVGPDSGGGVRQPTPPNDIQTGECICAGDSGGPALATTTGAVIGVTSRGGNGMGSPNPASNCTSATNFFTTTAAHKDVIMNAFADSGHEPWVEGGPDPRKAKFAEPCATADDCRSAICTTYKTKPPYCSRDCAGDGVCAMGYDCKDPGDGTRVCLPHEEPPPPPPTAAGGCSTSGGAVSGGAVSGGAVSGAPFAALAIALSARRRRRTARR